MTEIVESLRANNIFIIFTPKNCTSVAQPCDARFNAHIKRELRRLWREFINALPVEELPRPSASEWLATWALRQSRSGLTPNSSGHGN
eukprot:scaffold1295_cov220-Pinguiococcus_pyrenoidosus.AAC.11